VKQSLSTEHLPADLPGWRPGAALALLLGYFGLFGVIVGALGVLWDQVKTVLDLSAGAYGSAKLVSPLVAVVLLLQSGRLCTRLSKKQLALAGLALLAGSALALALAADLAGFVAALALAGAGAGFLETAMNGATMDWEQATRRSVMNVMHAAFSGGAILGAFGAGELLAEGYDYEQLLELLALLCGLALAATLPVTFPPVNAGDADAGGPGRTLRLLLSRRGLVVLGVLCLVGILGESAANDWSVIYLREGGATLREAGNAFALFNAAMFAGRLVNAPLVARFGPRLSLLLSGLALLLSALLLAAPASVPLSSAAFVVLGLAVAGVVPTVLSAAADLEPGQTGPIAGGMMAAAYAGFILCPPLVGWLAELADLQAALVCVGLSGLPVLWLARAVAPPQRPR
jgi:fucose permease